MTLNSTSGNKSKHQHWVPQFYLRYFATVDSRQTDQPQVWIFSKRPDDPDEALTAVRNVCGKRYLYSARGKDGERDWSLDEQLEKLESVLGGFWPTLVETHLDLSDEFVRKGLSLFTAVMYLRNPEMRKNVEELHQKLAKFFNEMPTDTCGIPMVSSVAHNGREHQFDATGWHDYRAWSKDDHDSFFANTVRSQASHIAGLLMAKRWSIVCAGDDVFITSDCPVSLHHQARETFGFGTKGATIIFPLSPQRILVMDDVHSEPPNQYYDLLPGIGAAFNHTIWRAADRFMITGRHVSDVLNEICTLGDGFDE